MASPISQKLEEKLVCSICLELFRVPVTLPCGHNFCKRCISNHWQKQKQEPTWAESGYTCPECRRGFNQCPELEKNVTLCSVVELAQDGEAWALGTERCKVASSELCPQHRRPLELYCKDEQRCICCVCTVWQCQQHQRVLFEEERSKRQALLEESMEKAQEESERIKQVMKELEEQTHSIKDSSEGLKSVILSKFALLRKALEDFQWQTVARIEQEQAVALGRVGEDWTLLKDRLDILGQHRERAQQLLACPDNRTFLQEFPLLPPLESPEALLPMEFDVAGVVKPITEILANISRLLLEDLPSCVAPKAPDPVDQDHRNLTFDPKTANKYLELSKGNRKAKHSPSTICRQQEQGPRFEPWQVLCTQGYSHGHHYWEVKISSHSVVLGVTYHSLCQERKQGHKFNIGLDGGSWGLQVREDCYLAWHKGRSEKIQEQLCRNLGVSLDYGKGLLSFYGLGERTWLIHSFHSVFTEPLYPVFWLCEGRAVELCWRD
ncbi:tripartite motif-containing protein 65 isoform X3 [Strigops habroptila]|uniref:tripartite motif-containing protein 65 isoform X3 n=1 Tax=Strigops habroptila TaxID=2489341 RepID=UPI0011CF5426|nr:tripartite motif-containing protein 65 isoform X3 [Strigops habroptila]